MKQFKTVFHFELMNYLKRKSYIVVTIVFMAVVAVMLTVVPSLLGAAASSGGAEETGGGQALLLVQNEYADAEYLNSALVDSGTVLEPQAVTPDEAEQMVDAGEYEAAIDITGPLSYTRYTRTVGIYDFFDNMFSDILLEKYKQDAYLSLGVPPQELQKIEEAAVEPNVHVTASGTDQTQSFFHAYVLIFALYMAIVIYGQFVASGVAAEKSTRAMELLITSAQPKSLIFGKVLGTGTAGLLQFALIIGTGVVIYKANSAAYANVPVLQSIFDMPPDMLAFALVFFLLGFFIYAFLFAAMGSLVSRMEDLGTTTQPVMLLFVVSFLVSMFSMSSGSMENPAIIACSFIPLTSPMAMFTRIALSVVPLWQILLSIGILFVSAVLIGILATNIYRLGVLLYGNAPKPKDIVRMLRNSRA